MLHRSTARLNARFAALAGAAGILALALSGCVPNTTADAGATALDVESSASACTVSSDSAPSGSIVFTVTNTGDQETEFYLLAEDGKAVVGEVERIGPGTSRDLVVDVDPGEYVTVCKPGMAGSGVGRAPFTVVDSGQ